MVSATTTVKNAVEAKAHVADEHRAPDEELLALKPEVVEPREPVQGVEVKVLERAGGPMPTSEAVKAQQQMRAGAEVGTVAARGE